MAFCFICSRAFAGVSAPTVPTFMFVDEFREALSHPIAARHFQDFLYEGRELNLAVWLSSRN